MDRVVVHSFVREDGSGPLLQVKFSLEEEDFEQSPIRKACSLLVPVSPHRIEDEG